MISKYVAGGAAIIIALLCTAIWLLMVERDALNEQVGELGQANAQLQQSLVNERATNDDLTREMERRDLAVLNAKRARERAESDAAAIRQVRDEALKDDPWIYDDVPAAVVDSLQAGARPDED